MTDQIFISHSRKDKKIMDYFVHKFTDTGIKPVCMEYELWSRDGRPNWRWIKDEIQKSKMLFLILTRNLTKTEYTQNWVAFEVGVASVTDPPIPVIVFTEENVDFPVPYLTHYFDARLSGKVYGFKVDFSGAILDAIMQGTMESILDQMIRKPTTELPDEAPTKCPKCLLTFQYMGKEEKLKYPCCSKIILSWLANLDPDSV